MHDPGGEDMGIDKEGEEAESVEFEIHFATQAHPDSKALRQSIYAMGFVDDAFRGQGVVVDPRSAQRLVSCPVVDLHVTWSTHDRDDHVAKRDEFEQFLDAWSSRCVGYCHSEAMRPAWDLDFAYKPFDASCPLPVGYLGAGPSDVPKTWDIHITAFVDRLNAGLQDALFDRAGMYYIDVRKPGGRVVRVFTVQGRNKIRDGLRLFEHLRYYLGAAGGMEGSAKFEQTTYWRSLGHPGIVPPTIGAESYAVA